MRTARHCRRHGSRRFAVASAALVCAAALVAAPGGDAAAVGTHWAEQAKVIGGSEFSLNAVAFDGDTLVVADAMGGPIFSEVITLEVYVRDGGPWTFQQGLTGDADEWIGGLALDLDGDTLAVGNPDDATVYVFHRSGTTWTRQQTLTGPGAFGESVAVDGDTLAVGEPLDEDADTGSNTTSGAVYLYTRSEGAWTEQDKVLPGDDSGVSEFGTLVALSGDTLAAANFGPGVAGEQTQVFTRSGDTWSLQQDLTTGDDRWALAVALDGDTLAVDPAVGGGGVKVYTRAGSTWSVQQTLDLATSGHGSLALEGDRLLVGDPTDDDGGPNAGAVYVMTRSGSTWSQEQKILGDGPTLPPNPPFTTDADHFGDAVALSGASLAALASSDNDANPVSSGAAHVFVATDETCGGQVPTRIGTPGDDVIAARAAGDVIVALDGDDTIIGLDGDELLCGGPGLDTIAGGAGDDALYGEAGRDTLFGGSGNDALYGGGFPDTLSGGPGDDLLDGGGGRNDWVNYLDSPAGVWVDLIAGAAVGDGSDTITGIEHVAGSTFDDLLIGDPRDNKILGYQGEDVIDGRAGDDLLDGGPANDVLQGHKGDDTIVGSYGRDLALFGEATGPVTVDLAAGTATYIDPAQGPFADTLDGIEHVTGSKWDDVITGDGFGNVLRGLPGDDTLNGGAGYDYLFGGAGTDTGSGGADGATCFPSVEITVGC